MMPLFHDIHGFAVARLYTDDTTLRILAKDNTDIGRIWTYALDHAPFDEGR